MCPGTSSPESLPRLARGVDRWSPRARVTVPFVCACGTCATCLRGEQQVCDFQFQPGFTHWGSFAERVAIDRADVNLVRVPDAMDLETAASLGCRFSTAYRAVVHHGQVSEGDWVVVHGCGGVGLSAVMIASAHGARVIAVDVSPGALELASAFGAETMLDASETDVVAAVREITGGARRCPSTRWAASRPVRTRSGACANAVAMFRSASCWPATACHLCPWQR